MAIDDIALTLVPGLGVKGVVHLLEVFGTAQAIFAASADELAGRAELRPDVARSIAARKSHPEAERELRHCRRHGITPLASTDDAYPALLREIPDYPHVLYIKGNAEVLSQRCLSMVGTRRISTYGQRLCDELVRGLTRIPQVVVVSGLAFGVDVACHRAALAAGIPTVGVLANPLPNVTPAQHTSVALDMIERGGALISELHSQSKQRGTFYLARNRIIAGLSAGTVVIESPASGGSLATAHYADGYDRTVMAPPGRTTDANSFGTNCLIRNRKALLIRSADDIAEELQWEFALSRDEKTAPAPTPELTAEEREVLSLLGDEPRTLAELIAASGRDYAALSVLLMGLELSQAARQPLRTFSISREQSRTCSGFAEARKRRRKFNESDKPRTMKLIDTHSHLYEPEFDDDREAAVARAREAGVAALLLPAIDTASDRRLFDLCRSHPEYCFPMIGLHPTSVNDNPAWREELARVDRYLLDPPAGIRFCAIGEIGLDYYWSDAFVAQQTEAFVAQLRLAARFDLPVAIHTRAAWDDMCRIIEAETERARADGRRLRGVFHAFSEGAAAFERLCGCGDFRFGIGGTVTFKKSGVAEIVRTMPLDRIVLETDCPYLTPAPYRGQRNESAYVRLVCDKIAELKGLAAETVAAATTANAEALFGIRYTEKNTERR